jgi:hypothetical protein
MCETMLERKKRDGSVRRLELQHSLIYHKDQMTRIEEELSRQPGAVSAKRVRATTKKWLEGLNTIKLRAQAQKVGLDPDCFEHLEDMVSAIMHQMGVGEP